MNTRFKELRLEKGLRQKDVAEKIGVCVASYGFYENWVNKPDPETLVKLADLYEVSIDYLLGRSDDYQGAKSVIERSPYEITDKQLINFMKLYKVMSEIQKAQVFGYIVALLENAGVNVKAILGY